MAGLPPCAPCPTPLPVNDDPAVTALILEKAAQADLVKVYPVAAVSRGSRGEQLCEFGELKEAGAIGVSVMTDCR
jgi:dihydroorotase